jgi:hypothetical protein
VEAHWHKIGVRPGWEPQAEHANALLLPWPMRVRASDFRPVEGSVRSPTTEPFGYFEFAPSEQLDLDLVDRMLTAALDEVDHVDVVILPESAVETTDIAGLEIVLSRRRVGILIAGVREQASLGQMAPNSVHVGVSTGNAWLHVRQAKHHRWSLDEAQIDQYHLGGGLHPHIRWWEAMEVPRRSIAFLEGDNGVTLATVICEDLSQIDEVAAMIRTVGPTIVVTPLLDRPQLSSRWASHYASVLADDPGSAVLTLTSYGMTLRSRPRGHDPSPVIALWKDPIHGTREIPLEPGAQGVLLTVNGDLTVRRSGDGRRPVENCTAYFDVGVHQVRAAEMPAAGSTPGTLGRTPGEPALEPQELTILLSWAEALAEALACAPDQVPRVLRNAQRNATWRAELGIEEPCTRLCHLIDALRDVVETEVPGHDPSTFHRVLAALQAEPLGDDQPKGLARRVLRSALEQRRTRHLKLGIRLVSDAAR